MTKRSTYAEKRDWLMEYINKQMFKNVTLCEGELEEEFSERFNVKLNVYTVGPCSCPVLAATLRRMWNDGLLDRNTGGNQDASYNCQKTYYVSYRLPLQPKPKKKVLKRRYND